MIRHLTRTPDTARNRAQWLSIADFLVRQNYLSVVQAHERKARAQAQAAAGVAGATPVASAAQGASHSIPVGNHGNHGEIVAMGVGV